MTVDGFNLSNLKLILEAAQQDIITIIKKEEIEETDSASECQSIADTKLQLLKEPTETLTLQIFGKTGFWPGQLQTLDLPQYNISGNFKIVDVTHQVKNNRYWTTMLTLKNEPLRIDKIFRKIYRIIE